MFKFIFHRPLSHSTSLNISRKAFTLIEIMVVLSIIASLMFVLIPNLVRLRMSSNEVMAQNHLRKISTSLEQYAIGNSQYPTDINVLNTSNPVYLKEDYFSGDYFSGYQFTFTDLTINSYTIVATPKNQTSGSISYTIKTGGVFVGQ